MNRYLAIVLYRCFIDDVYEGSIDTQVRYFEAQDTTEVELMITAGGDHSYQGSEGNEVTWKLDEIVCIEALHEMKHGEELIGFIRDEGDFELVDDDTEA
jgi:hypothetical protein